MPPSTGMHRTLIVANRTASTPVLLQEVERRAAERPTSFVLLVPRGWAEDWTEAEALRSLRKAARGPTGFLQADVKGVDAGTDALATIRLQLTSRHFDDLIVSTPPRRWGRPLSAHVEAFGRPVQVIEPPAADRSLFGVFASHDQRPAMGGGY
jgi:hypothetical protein